MPNSFAMTLETRLSSGRSARSIDLLFDSDLLVTDPLGLTDSSHRHVVLAYLFAARRQIWEFNKPDISVLEDFDARLLAHIAPGDRKLFESCLVSDPMTNIKTADPKRFSKASRLYLDGATFQVMMELGKQYCPLDYTMMALETFDIYSRLFQLALVLGVDRIFSMIDKAKSNLTSAVRLRQIPYSDFGIIYREGVQLVPGHEKIPYCFEDISNPAYVDYMLRFFSRERYENEFEPLNAGFTADFIRTMTGMVKSGKTHLQFASEPQELSERVEYLKRQFGIVVAPPKKFVADKVGMAENKYYFAIQFPEQPFLHKLGTGIKNRMLALGFGRKERRMIELFAQEIQAEIAEQKTEVSKTLQDGEETRTLTFELVERGETVVQDAMSQSKIRKKDLMISDFLRDKLENLQTALAEIDSEEFERRRQGRIETPSDIGRSKTPTDFIDLGRTLSGVYSTGAVVTARVEQFLAVEVQRYEALAIDAIVGAYFSTIDQKGFSRRLFRKSFGESDLYVGQSHSQRVGVTSAELGKVCWQKMMTESDMGIFRAGGEFHDVGKIIIPEKGILTKPERLSDLETYFMKKHPEYGMRILISLAYEDYLIDAAYCHHERWDGSGYPRGLKKEEIPFIARVIAVMDSLDAIIGIDRPYKTQTGISEAVGIILDDFAGKNLFDPELKGPFKEMADSGFFDRAYAEFRQEKEEREN